jgi:hypothetical protein
MPAYKSSGNVSLCVWIASSTLALGCSGAGTSNNSSADEASVVPGSACESADDGFGALRLEVTFPGRLNAAEIIAVTHWSNADTSCVPDAAWSTSIGELSGTAAWENSAVYVRQSDELYIETGARIGVVMDCFELHFVGAEARLDTARDGRGKLMAKCIKAAP